MRLHPIILSFAAAAMLLSSCKKEQKADVERPLTAGRNPLSCCTNHLGDSTISAGVITSNLFLQKCKTYKLSGIVYVANGAELFIETGTRIEGIKGVYPTPGSPGSGNPGGVLIITKGSKIHATGSPGCPIVFTSDQANPAPGDWGGVVILGRASTNVPTTTIVEGIGGFPAGDVTYGGVIDNDNSGELEYVRIEYAGYELSPDNELNGLTLAGVGSGTKISHVEVFKADDDAFGFFGGRVNCSYLVAVDFRDDGLDFDYAYRGTIDTALVIADTTRADVSQSNGIESDNNATGSTTTLITRPVLNYITVIGVESAQRAASTVMLPSGAIGFYGRAAHLRRNTEFVIDNSFFAGFSRGVCLDGVLGNTVVKYQSGISSINNSISQAYGSSLEFMTVSSPYTSAMFYTDAVFNGTNVDVWMINGTEINAPFNRSNIINFYATFGSIAEVFPSGALFPGDTWANNWVRLQ